MNQKLDAILYRLDSRQLSKLWLFYRSYFKNDESCLDFIYNAIKQIPVYSESEQEKQFLKCLEDENYTDADDKYYVPLHMLNCIESLVSAARDMDMIRQGEDIFKIVYIVTCVETLQKLRQKNDSKKRLLFDFFGTYTSSKDKAYIRKHFAHGRLGLYPNEDGFRQFVSVLNEYRNDAAHEGKFSKTCFKNHAGRKPFIITTKAELKEGDAKVEHIFETSISYRKFEEIFVRTCISFVQNYIASQPTNTSSQTRTHNSA